MQERSYFSSLRFIPAELSAANISCWNQCLFKTSRGLKAPNLFRGEVAPRVQLRRTLFALPSSVKDLSPLSTGLIMKVLSLWTPDQGGSPLWYCSITVYFTHCKEPRPLAIVYCEIKRSLVLYSGGKELITLPSPSAPHNPTCLHISTDCFLFLPRVTAVKEGRVLVLQKQRAEFRDSEGINLPATFLTSHKAEAADSPRPLCRKTKPWVLVSSLFNR